MVTALAAGVLERRDTAHAPIPSDPKAALAMLRDSVASLERQTTALRVVAGLAINDTAPSTREPVDGLIRRVDRLSAGLVQVASKIRTDVDKVAHTPSVMPTAGWLTSPYTMFRFHPTLHEVMPHLGIDIAAPYGKLVFAPAAGRVIRAGTASGYGLVMEIDHGNGIVTKYGHLSRFIAPLGEYVVRGEAIAQIGSSGLATGPHLHYEVLVNGANVDPLTYVLPSTIPARVRNTHRVVPITPVD